MAATSLIRRPVTPATRMAVLTFITLFVATVSGFGSAFLVLRGDPPLGSVQRGPWVSWPALGSRDIDPYARAIISRTGELPLGAGEGFAFVARRDSSGDSLRAACTYRVSGDTPPARAWTLTVTDTDGKVPEAPLADVTFTSADIVREADGRAVIALSRTPSPGNWLTLPDDGRFQLLLRLYDTPISSSSVALEARGLPVIEKVGCP